MGTKVNKKNEYHNKTSFKRVGYGQVEVIA